MRAPPMFPLVLLVVAVGFGAVVYAVERQRRRSGRAWVVVLHSEPWRDLAEPWQADDDPVPPLMRGHLQAERACQDLLQRARGQAEPGESAP